MSDIGAIQQAGKNQAKPVGLTPAETLAILSALSIGGEQLVSSDDRTLTPAELAKKLINKLAKFGIKPNELPQLALVIKQALVQGKIGRELTEENLLALINVTKKTSDPHREINDASVRNLVTNDPAPEAQESKPITPQALSFNRADIPAEKPALSGIKQTGPSLAALHILSYDPKLSNLVREAIKEQRMLASIGETANA
ncbi:MAG: hypothetical protein WCV91_05300 [Candidatus Margulisiibacteriota bacterium]